MTVLVDWEIKNAINDGLIQITPFDESLVNPASLDIRLGDQFGKVTPKPKLRVHGGYVIDPTDQETFQTDWKKSSSYTLMPKELALAVTLEKFNFLGDQSCGLAASVYGKSSLGRLQIGNSTGLAGWIDPGFNGIIVLEIFNYGDVPVRLKSGMKIGQLLIYRTQAPQKDYKSAGRYSNQLNQGSLGIA